MKNIIKDEFNAHIKVAKYLDTLTDVIASSAQLCINCINNGGKILIFGNGGSAADAQHIAAELVGRYKFNRKGLPAIALTTDTSIITSISNDFGYEYIFERQVEAIACKGDVLIGISTSGKSISVLKGLKMASKLKCTSIGLSGHNSEEIDQICDFNIAVPSDDTPRIQEMHIIIAHILCHLIDEEFKD